MFTKMIMGHSETGLTTKQRSRHSYVIGQPGTGKSRAFESWIMQDILAGKGVGVIDPHGDLFNNLLGRLAERKETWKRIVLFDPLDERWVVRFNPLEPIPNLSPERIALYMTDVAIKVWKIDPANAPRMVWLLTNSFLALSGLGLSLNDLSRFLIDADFRDSLLPKLADETARRYFIEEFPSEKAAVHQWVTPLLNKLGGLLFDRDIRLIFADRSTINFRQIMDDQMVLLINVPKGILGERSSELLAAFLVAYLQKAALSRATSLNRPPFYLYLDEFQNYTTDNISDILSESRKYALSLTLAHQYLDQLPSSIRSAVLNTTGTIISFRIGYGDAVQLSKEIFPSPDFIKQVETKINLRLSGMIPVPILHPAASTAGWNGLARELASLQPRQFWKRQRDDASPIKQGSFDMPDPGWCAALMRDIHNLREYCGKRHGCLKEEAGKTIPDVPNIESINHWSE